MAPDPSQGLQVLGVILLILGFIAGVSILVAIFRDWW